MIWQLENLSFHLGLVRIEKGKLRGWDVVDVFAWCAELEKPFLPHNTRPEGYLVKLIGRRRRNNSGKGLLP